RADPDQRGGRGDARHLRRTSRLTDGCRGGGMPVRPHHAIAYRVQMADRVSTCRILSALIERTEFGLALIRSGRDIKSVGTQHGGFGTLERAITLDVRACTF